MTTPSLVGFIIASLALIIIPGPNVLFIVSTSLAHGTTRGLQTVAGTSSAMLIQLVIAALGTSWWVAAMANGFLWLKWMGVIYLILLGITCLWRLAQQPHQQMLALSAGGTFARGFLVSLTNPKTILFFSAFLPQFVSQRGDYNTQIVVLSAIFLLLAMLLDSLYALAAGRISALLQGVRAGKLQKGLSGLLYLGAGLWLAALRKA